MKVILLTDVPKIGTKYEIKELKGGFAQNILIARGLACLATPQTLAQLESRKNYTNKKIKKEEETFSSLIASVGNKTITIKMKANEKGHLFKTVNSYDISMAIKKTTGIEINENTIIAGHIKSIGNHSVIIKKGDKQGKCEIMVLAE